MGHCDSSGNKTPPPCLITQRRAPSFSRSLRKGWEPEMFACRFCSFQETFPAQAALHPPPSLRMVRVALKTRMSPWFRSGHPSENRPIETTALPRPREAVFASRASVRRDATRSCDSIPFCQFAPRIETKLRRGKMQANSGIAGGRASPSPGALFPLFLLLSLRVGDSQVITCKAPQVASCLKNHQLTESD
jgi:hypothetical protein